MRKRESYIGQTDNFFSESRLCDVIQQIVGEANRYVNETSPIVDARLADGSRVKCCIKSQWQ